MSSDKDLMANNVSEMIEELYREIMKKRFELVDLKRQKRKDISAHEAVLEALQAEFNQITKTHTAYLKYLKAAGKTESGGAESMKEFLKMRQETKANIGEIVQEIPKN